MSIASLPSISHSQAAASEPTIEAAKSDFPVSIVSVEYASKASPAPTASTRTFTKDGIEKDTGLANFDTPTIPFSPSFNIKFLNLETSSSLRVN